MSPCKRNGRQRTSAQVHHLSQAPGRAQAVMGRWGAAEAARRLLVDGDVQSGFERLIREGHPELTVEWAVLEPRWILLFTEPHRDPARWRVRQAGHEVD